MLSTKVRRTGPYRHTEIWLVRYGSVTVKFDRYTATVDFDCYRPLTVSNGKKFDRYRVVSVNFACYISVTVNSDRYISCNGWYRPVQGGPRIGRPSDRYIPPVPAVQGSMENLA
ncbi:hypothetical protein B296_00016476 [Ensete ventricosum]|uniref:Uncharacterized protein n=1 Tax=Ensete ventricosum TaxID=4639 RepID=A0A426ZHD0_ENSVE|nr:hypothetical protein B296_00016476 [Ensete ventricosum]